MSKVFRILIKITFIVLLFGIHIFDSTIDAAPTKNSAIVKKKKKNNIEKSQTTPLDQVETPRIQPTSDFLNLPLPNDIIAKQVYMIDCQTGSLLLELDGEKPMHPSSMTKIMTAYIVADHLKKGILQENQMFVVKKSGSKNKESTMFLEMNKPVSVIDLLRGLIIQSGNDASTVLAENIAGSEANFSRDMTQVAKKLGAQNTNFKNASGLPEPDHLTTAKDIALISQHAMNDHPQYYSLYGEKSFTYNGIKQDNRNPLLYKNLNCDGIKTGYTDIAGYGLAASCKTKDRRIILVINGLQSKQARADEAMKLVLWGLNGFTNKVLYAPQHTLGEIPVVHGKLPMIQITSAQPIVVTAPIGQADKISTTIIQRPFIEAPLPAGTEIGQLEVNAPFLKKPILFPLITQESAQKANFFICLWQDFLKLF